MTYYITAWIALFSWPLIAIIFFRLWSVPAAAAATLIGGYLLLPGQVEIDLPVLPPLNKDTIPALSALFLVWRATLNPQTAQGVLPGWIPREKGVRILLFIMFAGAFGTALSNLDTVPNGSLRQAGLRLYDGFSIALGLLVTIVPFLIARKTMATHDGQRTLAFIFVWAAVAYGVLALWEVRMSPMLNVQLYGFFPHAWNQHIRSGGYRPILFLQHGLLVGIFLCSATVIAFGLMRHGQTSKRSLYIAAGLWLVVVLFFSKVLGAFLITLVMVPVVVLLSLRMQLLAAFCLGILVLSYPILRNIDVIPTTQAIALAEKINPARAESLAYRIRNEDQLLNRAKDRPLFGWGGWGRSRIYNDFGEDISTTDGLWVILFGEGGWALYLGQLGLLTWGILRLPFVPRDRFDPITVVFAIALTANLVDMLPNSGVRVVTWLMAGALVGRLEIRTSALQEPAPEVAIKRTSRYSRYAGPPKVRGGTSVPNYRRTELTRPNARQSMKFAKDTTHDD